jgi:hypothetical protein
MHERKTEPMPETYYRTGQAARQLEISAHHMRKLCEAGLIEADLSEGNQWRVPASEVSRLQECGVPPIPQVEKHIPPEPLGAPLVWSAEDQPEVDATSPEVQDAVNDLLITETNLKKRRLEREREEVEDFFRARDKKAAAERAEQARIQQQASADARKRAWCDEWQAYALRALPADAPSACRIEVHRSVAGVLVQLDHYKPEYIVRQLVEAAVQAVLRPYERQKRIARIIAESVETLPPTARSWSTPTIWQVKAKQAAASAIGKLDAFVTESELRTVAANAVQGTALEYQDGEDRKAVLAGLRYWMLAETSMEEREKALQIGAGTLAGLPVPTPRERMQNAVDEALERLRNDVKQRQESEARKRCAESLADANLHRIDDYLREEYEFDSFTEQWNTARELRNELRPILVAQLEREVLDSSQVADWIERHVDRRIS